MPTTMGCKDIAIRKSEFATKRLNFFGLLRNWFQVDKQYIFCKQSRPFYPGLDCGYRDH